MSATGRCVRCGGGVENVADGMFLCNPDTMSYRVYRNFSAEEVKVGFLPDDYYRVEEGGFATFVQFEKEGILEQRAY